MTKRKQHGFNLRVNKKRRTLGDGSSTTSSSISKDKDPDWEPYSQSRSRSSSCGNDSDIQGGDGDYGIYSSDMDLVVTNKSIELATAEHSRFLTQTKAALFDIMADKLSNFVAEDTASEVESGLSTPLSITDNIHNDGKIREEMHQLETELFRTKPTDVPLKHRILTMSEEYLNQRSKIAIVRNLNKFSSMSSSDSGYFKYRDYVEGLETIPFGRYIEQPVGPTSSHADIAAATNGFYKAIDGCLYGQHDAKNKLTQIIHNTWTNPHAAPQVIGLRGSPGIGKCLGIGTPVRMYNGSIKLVENIKVGDCLMGDDRIRRTVLSTCKGRENLYKIKQSHGDDYVVNESHILTLRQTNGSVVDVPVRDLLNSNQSQLSGLNGFKAVFKDMMSPISFATVEESYHAGRCMKTRSYVIADTDIQLAFIAGVFDFCGEPGWNLLVNQSSGDDIECILRGLGFNCHVKRFRKKRFKLMRITVLTDGFRNPSDIPVREYSPGGDVKSQCNASIGLSSTIEIEALGEGDYYGFEIDGNRRFLLGDFTVTHNTTLIKDGFAKAHGRPFFFCSLGGARDGSDIDGHHFTYEGSTCGWIVNCLMSAGVMNPVFFFDELDKISNTAAGREIIGILMHLIDPSQNDAFHDKYYQGIDFDLSKAIFIFSYNDPEKVDRILMDRITEINMSGYQIQDKLQIVKRYLINEMARHVGMTVDDVIFTDEVIQYIIREYTDGEAGVRSLRKVIQLLYLKLNILRFKDIDKDVMGESYIQDLTFPLILTATLVDKLVKEGLKNVRDDAVPIGMYL